MRVFGRILTILFGAASLLALVLIVGAYTFLPAIVESVVARNLEGNLGLSRTPEVSLSSEPAYEILAGRFESGKVSLYEPEFAGVRPERVSMRLDGFVIEFLQGAREGGLRAKSPLSGDIRVVLSEAELERIADASLESVPVREIGISSGSVSVGSSTRVLGVGVPISVRGPVDVEDGRITFSPDEVKAFGASLPEDVTDRILSGTDFGYPVEDLPFNGEITGIDTQDGTLVLEGSVRDLPVS